MSLATAQNGVTSGRDRKHNGAGSSPAPATKHLWTANQVAHASYTSTRRGANWVADSDDPPNFTRANAVQSQSVTLRREERQHKINPRQTYSSRLQSLAMLRPIQQDLVSALVNLGMPFKNALETVSEATKGREGEAFDVLFRECLPAQNQARKAAA